jgi:hypothetical protein
MSSSRKKTIQKAILDIENPTPEDNFILTYKDFAKKREFIEFYTFNPVVFHCMLTIANDEWTSQKRRNKMGMVHSIQRYFRVYQFGYSRAIAESGNSRSLLSMESRQMLFGLFQKSMEKGQYLNINQTDEIRRMCNNLLFDIHLTETEEKWLCSNINKHEYVLNRVLRYPEKSTVISKWAKDNVLTNEYRHRRAELTSWILDEDLNYELDKQILIDDFEYMNQKDRKTIQDYEDGLSAKGEILMEFGDFLSDEPPASFDGTLKSLSDLGEPDLKFLKRPYYELDHNPGYPVPIPNFKEMENTVYHNLEKHQKVTMIWAITYSRLNTDIKASLLKKYYAPETYFTMFKACKKYRILEMLKWIAEQN